MKQRTAIVGLGDIAKHHAIGLKHSVMFNLVAVCDLNADAPSRQYFPEETFYTDYQEMIEQEQIECLIIATPPVTHSSILHFCIERSVFALVEKPLTIEPSEFPQLLPSLKKQFDIIYHWMFSQEVLWFKRCMRLRNIKTISIEIMDDCASADGHVYPARQGLGGAWLDSGVNALSMLSLWVNLRHLTNITVEHKRDTLSGLPFYTIAKATYYETEIQLAIYWNKQKNFKQTVITTDKHTYLLNHSEQQVLRDGKEIFKDESLPRLTRHYYNFYALYPSSLIKTETTQIIHEILYQHQ